MFSIIIFFFLDFFKVTKEKVPKKPLNPWVCSYLPRTPPPPTVSALGNFFSATFLDYLGCLVRCEIDLVKVWVKLDKNKAEEGRPKFDE